MQDHFTTLSWARFCQVGMGARRHFGGELDQALTRAAENEETFLLGRHGAEESAEHHAFYRELTAMIPVATECIRLHNNGMNQERGVKIFEQALANVAEGVR